ncbi:MAG: PAS domain S-box protein [candidate division KSB1 bacterium]|nr:PAS domain S-box protein [candidate division KSB1 bacterium]
MAEPTQTVILHVDDNDAMRYAVGHVLRANHFKLLEASTGEEALRLAEHLPDLILLDVVLPDISGIEVCRILKSRSDTAGIPIVHLTALAKSGEERLLAVDQGADGYLTYPVDNETLIATIKAFLRIKRAEDALRESERRFAFAFKNAPITVCYQNESLRYSWVYGHHELLNEKRLLGKTDAEVFPPSQAGRLEALKRDVLATGLYSRHEVELTLDGHTFYFDVNIERLIDRYNRTSGVVSVLFDISDRKRAQNALLSILEDERRTREELRESEERFRTIYENTVIGIYRTTPDGRILMANPALVRMLGYDSFEELAQRNLNEEGFEPQYLRNEFRSRIERDGMVLGLESAWRRRDGSVIYVRENARLVKDEQGKPLYYEGAVEDITERRRAEQKVLEQLEELQRWHEAMLGRENRVMELKQEVNRLLAELGRPPKYTAVLE